MSTDRPNPPLEAALALQEPFLQRLARALVADENTAADLVQDTVAAALTHARSYEGDGRRAQLESLPPEGLRGWLSTVLRNTRTDRVRASRRARAVGPEALGLLPGRVDSPDGIAQRLERQQLLQGALMSLPEQHRTVLVLRYQDGMSIRKIADACACPVPTIKSRLQRGLGLLKDELQRRSGGESADGRGWMSAVLPLAYPEHAAPLGAAASSTSSLLTLAMWKSIALAVAAAALLLGISVLAMKDRSPSPGVGGAGPDVASVEPGSSDRNLADMAKAPRPSGEVGRQALAVTDLEAARAPDAGPRPALIGSVVSASSRKPVPALLWAGTSASTRASVQSGEFLLELAAVSDATLRLEHPMFELLEVPIPAWAPAIARDERATTALHQDLGMIELTPKNDAMVRVVDGQGRPVAGAKCTLHRGLGQIMDGRGPAPGASDEPVPAGKTDVDGRRSVRLAFDATVSVLAPDGRMGASHINAGESVLIRLDGPLRTALFQNSATGEPIAGRAFPMGWQQGAGEATMFLRTDASGTATLPAGAGQLTLCKGEPRLLLDGMRAGSRTIEVRRPGLFMVSAMLARDESQVTVLVGDHEVGLRLVNESTREPIDGTAYLQVHRLNESGEWQGVTGKTTYPVLAGAITVHSWFAEASDSPSITRRWIALPGYRIKTIASGVDLNGKTLALEPGEARRFRIVDKLGRQRARDYTLELAPGVRIRSRTALDGLSEFLPWEPGTPWQLWAPGVGTEKDGLVVAAETLAADEIVLVTVESNSGGIRFIGVPEGSAPLFAKSSKGTIAAVPAGPGALEARGLSPGGYAVGPQAWMTQLSGRIRWSGGLGGTSSDGESKAAFLVQVGAGETVEVPWDPRWASAAPVAGRVLAPGLAGSDLGVLPIYGLTGTSIYFGPTTPWIYCDDQGRFQTRPGDPQPIAFLLARFDRDGFGRKPVVLDSQHVRADGEYSIGLTSFELVATNAAEWQKVDAETHLRPTFEVETDGQQLEAPMQFIDGMRRSTWDPAEPIQVTGLPAHADRVVIREPREWEGQTMPITPGGHSRIEIVVPLPAPKASTAKPPAPTLRRESLE